MRQAVPGGATPIWTNPDDSNVLMNPDVPGTAGWVFAAADVTGGAIAPDGTATASTFIANSGSGDSFLWDQVENASLYAGETMTASIWLRSTAGTQTLNIYFRELGDVGTDSAAWKSVNVTGAWQQFQLSGKFQPGHNVLLFQVGVPVHLRADRPSPSGA